VARDTTASVAAALTQLLLAAHALGLGACWMTGPLVAAAELRALLAVPDGWELAALVPLGYPAEQPAPPRRRALGRLWQRVPPKGSEP
jgi:nitroreductase